MKRSDAFIKILLFTICAVIFTYNLGSALPIIESERFYFQSVKEMFARHDWITPYYQGQFRFQKPILFYWFVSISYLALGINSFAVRFPSALFGALAVIFTFNIGRRLFDRKTGVLAAGITATTAMFFMYSRYASPDMAFTFFTVYSVYLFLKGAKDPEKGKRFFKAFFAVLGLAVMTKGCAGFILPLIIVVSYIVSGRKWKLLKALNIPAGALIVLAIGLPWYIVMYALHGDKYLSQPLLQEALGRLFHALRGETIRAFLTEYAKNILPSIGAFIAWFLPYSLFLPAAAADSFKSRKTYSLERDSYKLILSYFFGIFVFFMITAPREYQYFLPLAPALGLMAARYFINIEERREQFKSAAFAAAYMSAAAIYGLCLTGVLYAMHRIYPLKTPACDYAVVLAPLIIVLLYLRRKSAAATFALPAAMALAMLFLAGRAMPLLNDKALPAFAEEIKSRIAPGDRVGVGSVDISQRRLEFFLDIPVEDVNVKAKSPDAAAEHKKKIADFLEKEGRAYLVIAEDDYAALVRDELKQGLVLVSRGVMWKNRLKRSVTREAFLEVLRGEKDILEDVLRHRVYLLTNRK